MMRLSAKFHAQRLIEVSAEYEARIAELEAEIKALRENYTGALQDVEHLEAEVAALREEVKALKAERREMQKRCGGENCMGWRLDHNTNWVSETLLQEVRRERDALRALVAEKDKALRNYGVHMTGDCLGLRRECICSFSAALALTEEDMREWLEVK